MVRIERQEVRVGAERVSVVRAAAHGRRKGVVLVPPLIGGSGMQQIRYFPLPRRSGYEVVSFDYRGHGQSDGVFFLAHALADTRAVLDALVAEQVGPVFGIGGCFGAIPLLAAAHRRPGAFSALALFNPVPNLQHMVSPLELLRNHFVEDGRLRLRNPLDYKAIIATTNDLLFPHVDKSREHFGILDYGRARMLRILGAYLVDRPLAGVSLPGPRAVVTYGRSDEILKLGRPEREERYRDAFRALLPRVEFRVLHDGDHYFTNSLLSASEAAVDCFDRECAPPAPRREPSPGPPERRELVPERRPRPVEAPAIEIAS